MNRPKVGPGKVRCDQCNNRTDEWATVHGRNLCTDCAPAVPLLSLPALLADTFARWGAA